MIRKNLPYNFNQLETALIAIAADLERKINQIHDDIPVFMLHNNDYSYFIKNKFEVSKYDEIIQKTPRVVFSIDDIQYQSDQNSTQFNKIRYVWVNSETNEPETWQATARRLAVNIILNIDFVSPNFVSALSNFEVMSTLVSHENVFTYTFMDNNYESAYVMQAPSLEKPVMDIGSNTRNFNLRITFDWQVHLMIPDVNSFIRLKDTEIDIIEFEINSNKPEEIIDLRIEEEPQIEAKNPEPYIQYNAKIDEIHDIANYDIFLTKIEDISQLENIKQYIRKISIYTMPELIQYLDELMNNDKPMLIDTYITYKECLVIHKEFSELSAICKIKTSN
jgi:hypothetical protein